MAGWRPIFRALDMVFHPTLSTCRGNEKEAFFWQCRCQYLYYFLPVFTFFGSTFPYCANTFIFDKLSNKKIACQFLASTHHSARLWVCRLNVCANHVSCTEEPLARSVEESNSLHCGCHLAMRSRPSVSWAPVVQHWTSVGSPAGPDGAKMSFGHSPASHL